MEQKTIKVGKVELGNKLPLAIIAGPCQIESREHAIFIAGKMVEITKQSACLCPQLQTRHLVF